MFGTLVDEVPPPVEEEAPVEQVLAAYERIADALDHGALVGESPDGELPVPGVEAPWSAWVPSGWLGVELDSATAVPEALSDADLIEGMVAFERLAAWSGARQARLLAEFARRRPATDPLEAQRAQRPCPASEFAPDEVGCALRVSRPTAASRLAAAVRLAGWLPATLAAWEAGRIDGFKARLIAEASYALSEEQVSGVQARVLPRAAEQTPGQLRAALARAIHVVDPAGAAERHQTARRDRRVVHTPEPDGMGALWALLPASDSTAAYQRLTRLARGLGAEDPRGMDARRADLLADLLTGRRCAATGSCVDEGQCAGDSTGDCSTPLGVDADSDADSDSDAGSGAVRAGDAAATGPADRGDPAGSVDQDVSGRGGGRAATRVPTPSRASRWCT